MYGKPTFHLVVSSVTALVVHYYTLTPVDGRSIAISISVCLSVCPLAYLEIHMSKFHEIFYNVTCGRGSVARSFS